VCPHLRRWYHTHTVKGSSSCEAGILNVHARLAGFALHGALFRSANT
jgi:hypothetical protein